jgi:2-C-methyl-D-erythritol 2,4-cyclodiphosphate synthase
VRRLGVLAGSSELDIRRFCEMKIGQGFDAHALVAGRRLVIGGVQVPFEKGLAGHSDADVLIHAVCDALLGAAGLGDIGTHFPDTDPRYKDIDSRELLREVGRLLGRERQRVINVDATVIAQAPRLAAHLPAMRANLASDIGISLDAVNIKAKSTERLGFTGRGEGIAAEAVALITCLNPEDAGAVPPRR